MLAHGRSAGLGWHRAGTIPSASKAACRAKSTGRAPMSAAVLASSRTHAHPDPVRITALSAAMAINLTVFLAATRPLPPLAVPRLASPAISARFIPPKPKPVETPPLPAVTPVTRHTPVHVATPIAATLHISDEGTVAAPPIHVPTLAPPV